MEIYFYVWPHHLPPGTRELIYTNITQVKGEDAALLALDTAYDLTRHRYALRLSQEDASAAFCVNASASASFQHSVKGRRIYSQVVDELNTQWLINRVRLAKALAS